ncbi:multi-sensor hybrid histidine kinase [Nostoc sp. NIES-3756]|uniref:ATP-binding protein n=1 Tax=Nostoc sp. NIES-3756 TaxID=1751286 RepID=UPI00072045BE|nr:ATP-binding protein [Nostoc sp. NIES-3756]BAT53455.1 multi-sensor hybrid histidine kinase [Nostoc sp. NIES-3756]
MQPSDKLNITEFITLEPINVSNCDREPIHIPGLIQPHGLLLTLREPELKILQISENVEQLLGFTPKQLIGQPLRRLCSTAKLNEIRQYIQKDNLEAFCPLEMKIRSAAILSPNQKVHWQNFKAMLHRSDGVLVLELEPSLITKNQQFLKFYHILKGAIAQIRQTQSFDDLLQTIVKQVRQITGFERVMVYQFATDNSGVVVAEDKAEHLESYLDLHYPASDIPQQARQLYYENWLRLIPNANYQGVRLIPSHNPINSQPLNLSQAHLRSVSPLHLQYLQNMGVTASMSISLINEKRLWGLIACHHYTPKYVDYETRKACEFLGQFASVELVYQQEQEMESYRSQIKSIQEQLRQVFSANFSFIEPVLRHNEVELLNLVHAQGVALILDNEVSLFGQTPSTYEVQELITWLSQQERQPIFVTDSLAKIYPQAQQFTTIASGVLAISIILRQKSYHLVWFRPEQIQTVNWVGDPHKPVSINTEGELSLTPRKSFELWKQTVQQTSLPWQPLEIEAATQMRNALMLAVLEFSQVALEQAAERAAIANRAKSQFLAKMSHELRTPLNAILGFTQLMSRANNTPTEFRENLNIITRSGEHLLTLINDVLEMSKIEAGQLILTETYFNLHRLLRSINDMFALRASQKGLNLISDWDATVPCYVCADEAKLRQILINLLANAIKFTATGTIIMRGRAFLSSNRQKQDTANHNTITTSNSPHLQPFVLHLEVEDTGCGIPASETESIFEAFMQTQQGRQAQGTGLGLSISRQFARLMNGDISVKSTGNQGSTFTCQVLLHLADSVDLIDSSLKPHVIGLEPGQPTYRILVAEDVVENRQLLIKLLETVGFEVSGAENGAQALSLCQEWLPHLIWMDIPMPVMDGYTATQKIRTTDAGKDVVIIALTASAFQEDYAASLQAGCNDYITKPFTETVLFDKMAHYLGVRYLYAQETASDLNLPTSQTKSLTPSDLRLMPPGWIAQVHEAALDLDDAKLYKLIQKIPSQNKSLADALKSLIDNFHHEAITTLTQP